MAPKLSKTVLEMKFMKRTKERLALEAAAEREVSGGAAAMRREQARGRAHTEPSAALCLELRGGRFSCRGLNPALERLLQQEQQPDDPQPGVDVSDKEMAAFYNPLVATMASKFDKNASNHKKGKRKLLQPPKTQAEESPNVEKSCKRKKPNFLKPNL